jgi:hypothetical protein
MKDDKTYTKNNSQMYSHLSETQIGNNLPTFVWKKIIALRVLTLPSILTFTILIFLGLSFTIEWEKREGSEKRQHEKCHGRNSYGV